MTNYTVEIQPDFLERLTKAQPIPAVSELIWNGLDADRSPHFPVFKEFQGASYLKRYDILCQRLIQENLYGAATVLASPREAVSDGKYGELSELTSLKVFITTLAGHIAAEAAR